MEVLLIVILFIAAAVALITTLTVHLKVADCLESCNCIFAAPAFIQMKHV